MKEQVIEILRAKGIKGADVVLNELEEAGILTHYDFCKYVAREEYFRRAAKYPKRSSREIISDIAAQYDVSFNTVRRTLV